jgi:hypothetical protein
MRQIPARYLRIAGIGDLGKLRHARIWSGKYISRIFFRLKTDAFFICARLSVQTKPVQARQSLFHHQRNS